MSYIRFNSDRERFDGKSEMYVYGYKKGNQEYISQNGYDDRDMIEMLDYWWGVDDPEFKEWFIKRLCERLGILNELKNPKEKK